MTELAWHELRNISFCFNREEATLEEMKPLYIVAVSGGVDSVVLLDRLVRADEAEIIVAHVDHGIRAESREDAMFVERLTHHYGVPFVSTQLRLGPDASEQTAREGRWEFLRAARDEYRADKIVTAHHSDDVIETMIINIVRGTSWRGVATLRETSEIKRPLLAMRKQDIIAYAKEHGLQWHEDATNQDRQYLRNRVRHDIVPRLSVEQREALERLHTRQLKIRADIERILHDIPAVTYRYIYIMQPDNVARELLRKMVGSLTQREYDRTLLFIRTARPYRQLRLSNGKILKMGMKQFIVLEAQD